MTSVLTQTRVRELFDYKPKKGVLIRRVARPRAPVGSIAGRLETSGHLQICIDQKNYRVHRVIWLWVYGIWPLGEIDHINRSRADNRIANLRDVTRFENQQNRCLNINNKSGFTGVSWYKYTRKWTARINVDCKRIYLGYFDKIEDAVLAYATAKKIYHSSSPHNRDKK